MDPDTNLKEQLRLTNRILSGDSNDAARDSDRLAELVTSFNEWLEGGGALPKAWQPVKESTMKNCVICGFGTDDCHSQNCERYRKTGE